MNETRFIELKDIGKKRIQIPDGFYIEEVFIYSFRNDDNNDLIEYLKSEITKNNKNANFCHLKKQKGHYGKPQACIRMTKQDDQKWLVEYLYNNDSFKNCQIGYRLNKGQISNDQYLINFYRVLYKKIQTESSWLRNGIEQSELINEQTELTRIHLM